MIGRLVLSALMIFATVSCTSARLGGEAARELTPPEKLKADLDQRTLKYFLEHAHPVTGLVRDRAENFKATPDSNRVASIAATGFGLTVISNASLRGLVSRDVALAYAKKTLRFTRDKVGRRKGWMFHFIDWETGEQAHKSEYSTVDTALFMAGALYAAQVLNDAEVRRIAYQLYNELDFNDMMTDGGAKPKKKTLSMAYWNDGSGYRSSQWDMYAEQMILLLLGLGHPAKPLPTEAWAAFERKMIKAPNGEEMMGYSGALFVHQYSQAFVDFRGFRDGFTNYHANSIVVSQYHREMIKREPDNATLKAGFWGFSAGEAPGGGYHVFDATQHLGIVCIGCTMASVMFMPDVVLMDMMAWRDGEFGDKIYGRYGFTDSLDVSLNWFSPTVLGVTVGPAYMGLANMHAKTSIWKDFMAIPAMKTALARASEVSHSLAAAASPPVAEPPSEERAPASKAPWDP